MLKKTHAEKQELRKAKRDYKLSLTTDFHENNRQEFLKAIFDGIKHAERSWGGLKLGTLY